ncbi:arylsulfatase [Flavobacterium sp. ov086]|uniref:arylsulfatase n=1 Tax=Flavobacterium sp. ov086 TaxID=1761785 RepID=UPI000B65A78E|nr:arylsulfatase [Flavobacterium sp. ov086]SNR24685.1 arylsulfatase [Flavobacterium sp. ov086]
MKQIRFRCGFKNAIILIAFVGFASMQLEAQDKKKPNVLILWGDDIGTTNISAYSDGVMGYTTPNIDRLANEGLRFLHYYGEQSCTAGRAALLTGQHGLRTGLTKVGFPGAPMGMSQLDPSIGGIMKNLGYTTGQFGKNHVGDRNESLPTVNGFDEFFGNLYHLNAEEEPELPDYPKDPEYLKKFGPRGVLKCTATNVDDATTDPRFGRVGKQRIEDTGPLTKKRMETVDDETSAAAIDFIKRQNAAGKPFFCWFNATRMHLRTHVRAEHRGKYTHGDSEYIDGMIEHDETIGSILKALDELGIADNTIVVYSTDNGPHMNTWPDAAMTPYRSEKNTNWEGAYRVPCIVRWPGVIKPGQVTTEIMSHNDWMPTLASIAGEPDLVNKLLKGYTANGKNYKVHLDGYDQSNFLRGKTQKSARDQFFYTDDDGLLVGLREGDYKYVFAEQRLEGTMGVWAEPFTKLRLQKIFNLYQDPFERADITSNTFWDWQLNHVQLMYGAIQDVVVFAETFKDYPPRSIPPSFSAYTIMEEAIKDIKAQKYIEKNVLPKLKEDEAPSKKK